eukprot:CAMPEP_0118645748 /NCGR_PEP_ID=MMETSP0785-20121206/7672_1 /TAXON_ID=91992 /ORGANISM="Bolidomonas pacifica, Strain CCMP 1866" /LENGTH=115 /DNA_ID=CAMNT_0006537663 /DNA_START=281 /DNA_END=625 /DNA_ORIENTATION=-
MQSLTEEEKELLSKDKSNHPNCHYSYSSSTSSSYSNESTLTRKTVRVYRDCGKGNEEKNKYVIDRSEDKEGEGMKIGDMPMPRMIGIPGLFQFGFSDNTGRGGKGVDLPVLPTQE